MTGFVSFVSSGPGDPELLTLKAVARLQAADAVLYDDLSSGPILAHVRAGADLVSVGKRAGRVSPRQHHVSRLLVDYATTHARVVRLKSGDAGIFGRLEEEIEALTSAGIGYEIIPGVTAACAAAAAVRDRSRRQRRTSRRTEYCGAGRRIGDVGCVHGQAHLSGSGAATDRSGSARDHAGAAGRIRRPSRSAPAADDGRRTGRPDGERRQRRPGFDPLRCTCRWPPLTWPEAGDNASDDGSPWPKGRRDEKGMR